MKLLPEASSHNEIELWFEVMHLVLGSLCNTISIHPHVSGEVVMTYPCGRQPWSRGWFG